MKIEICKNSQLLQRYPNAPPVRRAFFISMKVYNKTRKWKARQFRENLITKLDDLKTSNPQSYWKLLESLKDDKYKDNTAENIEMAEWELYLKKLNENCNACHNFLAC